MPLMLKLRRKVSPPEQIREFPPQPDPRGIPAAPRFLPDEWYSCEIDPPKPGLYDSRMKNDPANIYEGKNGNFWDGKDWFYSKYEKNCGRPQTVHIRLIWQWRMPK